MQAYAQEAALLGVHGFAPLQRTAQDIRADREAYLGGFESGRLVAAVAFGPDVDEPQLLVSSLVVEPAFQRRGIGRALMAEVLRLAADWPVAVSTALENTPALALYDSLGFVAYRWGSIGPSSLQLVKLRWPQAATR